MFLHMLKRRTSASTQDLAQTAAPVRLSYPFGGSTSSSTTMNRRSLASSFSGFASPLRKTKFIFGGFAAFIAFPNFPSAWAASFAFVAILHIPVSNAARSNSMCRVAFRLCLLFIVISSSAPNMALDRDRRKAAAPQLFVIRLDHHVTGNDVPVKCTSSFHGSAVSLHHCKSSVM